MDSPNLQQTNLLIDLESGTYLAIGEEERYPPNIVSNGPMKGLLRKSWSSSGAKMLGKEAVNLGNNFSSSLGDHNGNGEALREKRFKREVVSPWTRVCFEDPRKKALEKYPKPPRPPKSTAMRSADRYLLQEISELVLMKRARIERMKALKKKKNAKAESSCSNANFGGMIITILFFLLIVWQAL